MDERARQALLAQANQFNQGLKPAKKGNLFTNSLSTAGGILGGIGGSFLAPGLGTAAGGAAGAGFGKLLENLLEGNDAGEGVLGEAALGTLGGIGKGFKAIKGATGALKSGEGLGKAGEILRFGVPSVAQAAPKTVARAGRGLENLGAKMLGSQSQLTGAQARQKGINPAEALASINKRTGLTSLDDMAEVSKGLTGSKDSMLDMLTREAVGNTKGVNVPDLHATAKSLLDDMGSLIPDSARKRLLNNVTRAGTTMRGGSKGTLSALANPSGALDQANAFRGTARELTNSFTSTPEQKQLAKVYNSLASTIEDSIYKSPGVNQSIPMLTKAGADDLLFKAQDLAAAGNKAQAKAYEKVALELRDVKDVAQLRKMKKDFVDIGKIDTATAQAQGARSLSGADMTNKAGSILRNPMNTIAMPLDAATPAIGGTALSLGRTLQGGLPSLPNAAKIAGTQLGGRALTGSLPGQANGEAPADVATGEMVDPMTGLPSAPAGLLGGVDAASALGGAPPQDGSIYTREAVAQDIQRDLQETGGANMDKFITLYNFMNPETKEPKEKQASVKEFSQANTALSGVNQLGQMLAQDPGISDRAVAGQIPIIGGLLGGVTGTSEYNATANNILNSIARLNTGANMPSSEEAMYRKTYLPQPGDSDATKQQKMATLQQFFQPFTAGY